MLRTFLLIFVLYASLPAISRHLCSANANAISSTNISISPADSSVYFAKDTVRFSCEISSAHTISNVQWTSNKDGVIGSGTQLSVNDLSEGEHSITAVATIEDGTQVSKSIALSIRSYESIDVFCVGGNSAKGVYWINNTLYEVSGSSMYFTKIAISDNNLCLIEYPGFIWINGQKILLPSNLGISIATSICFVGKTNIVAGYDRDSANRIRRTCYWKDGVQSVISDYGYSSLVHCSKTGELFIGGRDTTKGFLWNDGKFTILDSVGKYPQMEYIGMSSGLPCLAGNEPVFDDDAGYLCGWFWKEGKIFRVFADSSLGNPFGRIQGASFFSYGVDLFCVGRDNSGYFTTKYYLWKNGHATPWFDSSAASAVYVHHGHVFIGGSRLISGGSRQLCYWRNGKQYNLPGAEKGYSIYAIYVVDKDISSSVRSKRTIDKSKNIGKKLKDNSGIINIYNLSGRKIASVSGNSVSSNSLRTRTFSKYPRGAYLVYNSDIYENNHPTVIINNR